MRKTVAIAVLTCGLYACGNQGSTSEAGGSGGGPTSSGGVQSAGGTTSSGGAQGSGGAQSLGGSSGTTSSTPTGGSVGSGGTSGEGGVASSGGKSGSGGLGAGGKSGSGGNAAGTMSGTGGGPGAGGEVGSGGAGGSSGQPDAALSPDGPSNDLARDGVAADAARPDVPSAQCPGTNTLKAGSSSLTLQHGGRTRGYRVYVPTSVKAGTAVPLVFDFHGHGANAAQEESSSGWKKKADQVGFIVAYPEGYDSSWNVGNCCGKALSENVDDVGFTRAVLEAIGKAACIDPKRVYATGMSNGAGFVQRLGCEAADVIAAIAAASADLVTDPCTPARPISQLSVRGLSDTMVAYEGGKTGSTGWYSPGAKGTLELWKEIDQCTGSAQASRQHCETYSTCAAGVEVTLCSLPNTGHDTYANAVGMSVPDVAWEMFQRQPMP